MSLADSTIRRCFHHGDFIIREARETRSLRQSHRLDNCSGPTRFRKGLRKKGNQGRPLECSAVVFEVGSWHEEQRRQQIWVCEEELSLEFEERLEAHCKALQTIRRVEPLPPFLEHELECMHRRLDQFKDSNRRRQVLDRLRKALGAVGYAIQKITDLSASEQFLRMTRYWQHLDWMYHMIKSKNVAVLQAYCQDPRVFVRAADDTVIFLFDEVPKWVALVAKRALLTAKEAQAKRQSAAARAQRKRIAARAKRGRSGAELVLSGAQGCSGPRCDHVAEVVEGPQGGSGADKFRITTIMLQFIYNYFMDDVDPVGDIGPKVCIFFGALAQLEEIDEHGVDKTTGQQVHPALMQEWRSLRSLNLLEGLNSELFVWQQQNAYANDDIIRSMYRLVCKLVAPRPVMGIVDAASSHWSASSKAVAHELNAPLIQVPRGLTMPAQLTDAELAVAKAATEPRCRARILREKRQMGEPLQFDRLSMYRLCLEQHRYTVKLNQEKRVVILGSRRCGILSRRPLKNGDMQNVDNDVLSAVGRDGRSGCEGRRDHWSIDENGHAVTTGSTRMKPEWVAQRHSLPLERPIYDVGDLDVDFGPAPIEDPSSECPGIDDLPVTDDFVGEALVQKRIEHVARTMSSTMMTDLAARKERARLRLQSLGRCTCGRGPGGAHTEKCPQSYWTRYNALVLLAEQERSAQQKLDAAAASADREAARRRAEEDKRASKRPRTEQETVAESLLARLSNFRRPTDKLVSIGVKLWGSDVRSLADEHGRPRLDSTCLPFTAQTSQRTWIFDQLKECCASPQDFFTILKSQEMCLDYALMALRATSRTDTDRQAAAAAASDIVPSAWSSWIKHRCRGLRVDSSLKGESHGASAPAAALASSSSQTAPEWELNLELPQARRQLLREKWHIPPETCSLLEEPQEMLQAWLTDAHLDVAIADVQARLSLQPGMTDIRILLPWEVEFLLLKPWVIAVDKSTSAVLAPVSNAVAGHGGGSHWSVMSIAEDGSAIHVDSLREPSASSLNKANLILAQLSKKLPEWNLPGLLRSLTIRQQSNGVDCGVFAWLHMEAICRHLLNLPEGPLRSNNLVQVVNQRRKYMVRICKRLAAPGNEAACVDLPGKSMPSGPAASASPAAGVTSSSVAPIVSQTSAAPVHAVTPEESIGCSTGHISVAKASPSPVVSPLAIPAAAAALATAAAKAMPDPVAAALAALDAAAKTGTAAAPADHIVGAIPHVSPAASGTPVDCAAEVAAASCPSSLPSTTGAAASTAAMAMLGPGTAGLAIPKATETPAAPAAAVGHAAEVAPETSPSTTPAASAVAASLTAPVDSEIDLFLDRGSIWKHESWTYHFPNMCRGARVRWDPKKDQFQCQKGSERQGFSVGVKRTWRQAQEQCLKWLKE